MQDRQTGPVGLLREIGDGGDLDSFAAEHVRETGEEGGLPGRVGAGRLPLPQPRTSAGRREEVLEYARR
jgi:hypothetical protein